MKYRIDETRTLVIGDDVESTFAKFRPNILREHGGVLLGRVYPTEVRVEIATPPTPLDKAGPTFFDRSRVTAQLVVDREWGASNGERIYLGEWHTHPQIIPSPSSRDRDMILNMLGETKMYIEFLFLIVVGFRGRWVGVRVHDKLERLKTI